MRKVFEGNGGMVCLFEFVEELKEALHESEESKHSSSPLLEDDAEEEVEYERERERGTQLVEKPWVLSDVVTEKKSVFIARAIRVYDPQEAKTWVEELVRGDRKLARATHNIYGEWFTYAVL